MFYQLLLWRYCLKKLVYFLHIHDSDIYDHVCDDVYDHVHNYIRDYDDVVRGVRDDGVHARIHIHVHVRGDDVYDDD